MITAVYDVRLCTCCVLLLANDDRTGCDDTCSTDSHPRGLLAALALLPGEVCVPGSGEPDPFGTDTCDGCGTRLAGERHTATVLGPDLPQDHLQDYAHAHPARCMRCTAHAGQCCEHCEHT
jgi:hypothetical protein